MNKPVRIRARLVGEKAEVTPEIQGQMNRLMMSADVMRSYSHLLLFVGICLWLVSLYLFKNAAPHSRIMGFILHELPIVFAIMFTLMAFAIP